MATSIPANRAELGVDEIVAATRGALVRAGGASPRAVTGVTTDSSNEVALDLGGVNDNVALSDISLVL